MIITDLDKELMIKELESVCEEFSIDDEFVSGTINGLNFGISLKQIHDLKKLHDVDFITEFKTIFQQGVINQIGSKTTSKDLLKNASLSIDPFEDLKNVVGSFSNVPTMQPVDIEREKTVAIENMDDRINELPLKKFDIPYGIGDDICQTLTDVSNKPIIDFNIDNVIESNLPGYVTYPLVGERYKHFKGGTYVVESLAKNTETNENMVVYKSVEFGSVFVRPLAMFFDMVVNFENKRVQRFTLKED